MRSLGSRSSNQSQGCKSGHVLPSRVAPSQVHKSGDSLGNRSCDERQEIAIRWKNGVWTLQAAMSTTVSPPWAMCLLSLVVLSPGVPRSRALLLSPVPKPNISLVRMQPRKLSGLDDSLWGYNNLHHSLFPSSSTTSQPLPLQKTQSSMTG